MNRLSQSRKKVALILTGLILVMALAAAGGVFFFKIGGKEAADPVTDLGRTPTGGTSPPIFEDLIDLAPFERIGLSPESEMRFISLNLSLELTDPARRNQVETSQDRIRDIVTLWMARKTWMELRTSEGKIMLKYDLLKQINSVFSDPVVRNIYFTYFIMQ